MEWFQSWQLRKAVGLAAFAVLVVNGALVHTAARAQVLLEPVGLELSQRQRIAVLKVTLSDRATAPVRLQAELLRWSQDARGEFVTEPTDELLVSPPIADLMPGQRQVFRVALRAAKPSLDEVAYRLVLEDIRPDAIDAAGKRAPGISIRMRYDLPVMVAPSVPVVQALRFKPCTGEPAASQACLQVRNAGNRRVRVQSLQLAGEGWQQSLALGEGGLLLAGAGREWRVPLAGAEAGKLRGVSAVVGRGETVQVIPEAP